MMYPKYKKGDHLICVDNYSPIHDLALLDHGGHGAGWKLGKTFEVAEITSVAVKGFIYWAMSGYLDGGVYEDFLRIKNQDWD